jgi:hypothetical protein
LQLILLDKLPFQQAAIAMMYKFKLLAIQARLDKYEPIKLWQRLTSDKISNSICE